HPRAQPRALGRGQRRRLRRGEDRLAQRAEGRAGEEGPGARGRLSTAASIDGAHTYDWPVPEFPELVELRVPRFKSVRDGVLPLHDLTLLVGRNGSGKSNVLEALEVLARIASGDDLHAVLDGSGDAPFVRGGAI